MAKRIRGSFPGGPSHSAPGPQRTQPARLESVAEIEARMARRSSDRRARRRRIRIVVGFAFAFVLAGSVGVYVGHETHHPARAESSTATVNSLRDLNISWQVNRTLLQLWKMEDVEGLRGAGLSR